jgi:hypothetical protein
MVRVSEYPFRLAIFKEVAGHLYGSPGMQILLRKEKVG